ncbi:MAG: hypothetical protein ACQKBU_02195 [Verrucomicrobiales bacterium]
MMRLVLIPLCLSFCACGLIRAPFKLAGSVTKGTAQLGKAAVAKPMEMREKRKAEKEAEKKRLEDEANGHLSPDPLLDSSATLDEIEGLEASLLPSEEAELPPLPQADSLRPISDE